MSIPFEQDVEIEKFVRKFKSKHNVRGEIYIVLTNKGFDVDNKQIYYDEDDGFTDLITKLKKEIKEEVEEDVRLLGGIDLYDFLDGDEDTIEELIEYYESRK